MRARTATATTLSIGPSIVHPSPSSRRRYATFIVPSFAAAIVAPLGACVDGPRDAQRAGGVSMKLTNVIGAVLGATLLCPQAGYCQKLIAAATLDASGGDLSKQTAK